jgi:hypothetical protein
MFQGGLRIYIKNIEAEPSFKALAAYFLSTFNPTIDELIKSDPRKACKYCVT